MKKIVLFASGNGSNAENIMAYFDESNAVSVVGVFSNNSEANVIERAKKFKQTFTDNMDNKSKEKFDYVFFACHSDEALDILKKPTANDKIKNSFLFPCTIFLPKSSAPVTFSIYYIIRYYYKIN